MLRLELKPVDVDNKEQDSGSFHMLEELVSHALVEVGAFDESRQIREADASIVVEFGDAQIGTDGGEWIAGYLRLRTR